MAAAYPKGEKKPRSCIGGFGCHWVCWSCFSGERHDGNRAEGLSDSEMDNVTAAGPPSDRGLGLGTAGQASGGTEGKPPSIAGQSGVSPGGGKYTAPGQQ